MNYEQQNNRVYVSGVIASDPTFSHEVYGEGFFETTMHVERLSEQVDVIPITVSERLMQGVEFSVGTRIALEGQFRSYNKIVDGKSKLMLTVFAREILPVEPFRNPNTVVLSGYLCKPPVYRTTPFSREIADLLIAVNRAYNKSDYIPCIAWGRNARFVRGLSVGDRVSITGRVQSREYTKRIDDVTSEVRTAYEISVSKIAVGETDFYEDGLFLPITSEAESIGKPN